MLEEDKHHEENRVRKWEWGVQECGGAECARAVLIERVTVEQRLEGSGEISHADI